MSRAHLLLPPSLNPELPRRLVCLPHAGGGAGVFYRWQRWFPPDVALVPLRLPGREDRLRDAPYRALDKLADDAAAAIASLPPRPFAILGHSMGAYVAWEVARRLESTGGPLPHRVVVAACGAPRPRDPTRNIGHLGDDEFIEAVSSRYAGIPDGVRNEPELLALVLPPLRADLQMIESYAVPAPTPIATPMTALGGEEDPSVAPQRLEEWRQWTTGSFAAKWFEGGHFFLYAPGRRNAPSTSEVPFPLRAVLDCLPEGENV